MDSGTITYKASTHVGDVCTDLGIIGSDIKEHLKREIPSKIIFRKAKDVVLLSGHTGTGKEVIASACHRAAKKALGRGGELVEVNCANLGNGIFESQLFGYKRGAFTGADRDYGGLVAKAKGGTLVLDEIQSLVAQDQARLLRFLGEREYRSVGDHTVKQSDALIILSTNRDLREMVELGEFRRDIVDRAAAKIQLPPLFERRNDISELSQAFAREVAEDLGAKNFYGFTRQARADIETAIIRSSEVSIRKLREVVRDMVFANAIDDLPEALDSHMVHPFIHREFQFAKSAREAMEVDELESEFNLLVAKTKLIELAKHHDISINTLNKLTQSVQGIFDDLGPDEKTYRRVSERMHRLSKVALWLVSGAETQADFRKYFGTTSARMPPKSVAHQLYYEVFPEARK